MRDHQRTQRRTIVAIILWVLALAWLILCFLLSWRPGEESAIVSWRIADLLMKLLALFGIHPDAAVFHASLRHFAHLIVFFIAGMLFSGAFIASLHPGRAHLTRSAVGAGVICGLSGALTEICKQWIPTRHLQGDELALNLLGAALGIALVSLAVKIVEQCCQKKTS